MLTKLFKKRLNLILQHDTQPNQSNLNEFIRIFNYSSNVKYEAIKHPDGEIIVGFKLVNNNKKNTNNKILLPTDIIDNPLQIDRGPNPYLDNSIDPLDKFKQDLYCRDTKITNKDMVSFLNYIKEFIKEFIFDKYNKYSSTTQFMHLLTIIENFNNEIIIELLKNISKTDTPYVYINNDIFNYTREYLVSIIKEIIDMLNTTSRTLIESIDPAYYYIHRISIILRRLLLDLYDIIEGKQIILTYIPIKYIKLFIYNINFRHDKCYKNELLVKCQEGNITNYNMKCFLEYIKEFINKFIIKRNNNNKNNNNFYILYKLMYDFNNNNIVIKLYDAVNNNDNNDNNYVYTDNRIELLQYIKQTIKDLKEISKDLIDNTEPVSYYIHHIAIILRRLLFDLYEIIKGKQIFLAYIPIKYMELFISKIHFRNKCPKDDDIKGGVGKKYKKTNNKITVLYKKKKYTRNIHINERKKYVKINKTFILLSKLKKI